MDKKIIYELENKSRIDIFLSNQYKEISRSHIKKMIDEGNILVNCKQVKSSHKLQKDDFVEIKEIEPRQLEVEQENIDINIIYEDDDVIIVDKPKGLVVHPASGNERGTLVNAIMYHAKDKLSSINGVVRPGIVHRIDKDTSGILVIAKNDNAHIKLSEQFKEHSITRKYIALVHGEISKDNITINLPIGRDIADRKKMKVTIKNSKNAITHIKVIQRFKGYTLVEATLETGRTHQIRVHLSHIGFPIVGDYIYGKKKNEFSVEGQMLHAKHLGFIHPTTGEYIYFESELPEYFKEVLDKIK